MSYTDDEVYAASAAADTYRGGAEGEVGAGWQRDEKGVAGSTYSSV
jgi:hypothetical protein